MLQVPPANTAPTDIVRELTSTSAELVGGRRPGSGSKKAQKRSQSFFGQPDSSVFRMIINRPDRLDIAALVGRTTLVINGFDPSDFSGDVIYAETSAERAAALDPQAPLRGLERNESTERLFREHWRPTLDLRVAPACRTDLPPKSIARIIVHEAQGLDPSLLCAEIRRVAMPNAKVTIAGVGPVHVEPSFDAEFNQLLKGLAPLRTPGERSVWSAFKDVPLDLDERASLVTKKGVNSEYARARWTFSQLERYLRNYPVIERAQQLAQDGGRMHDMPAMDINGMFARLKQAWGSPTKTRPIYWPVRILTGFMMESAPSACGEEGVVAKITAEAEASC